MERRTLVFVPTYNERDNAEPLCRELRDLGIPFDLLFLDDNSPDGTGEELEKLAARYPRVYLIRREGKQGIGSAHKVGLRWARAQGYLDLVTMDADFTHPPSSIPQLLAADPAADIVVGSRHLSEGSLDGWNWYRKSLTKLGHILTKSMLGIEHDATGAFRLYRLDRIPADLPDAVESDGYAFFFESLFLLNRRGAKLAEIPISLPPRTYGSSKMTFGEIFRSVHLLFTLYLRARRTS